MDTDMLLSRRVVLAGAGALLASPAVAAEQSGDAKMIADFLKLWSAADATGAKLAAFMTEDAEFRYERKPAVIGRAALTAAFDGYLAGGKRYRMEAIKTQAQGPVVFQVRHETLLTNGAAGHTETLAGLFIMAGGKIKIWENFLAD